MGEVVTLEDLKKQLSDMLTDSVMMELNHGLINDTQFEEKMAEVEDIENMTAAEFYPFWNLVREVVKP